MLLVLRIAEALHLDDEQTVKLAGQLRAVEAKRAELIDEKGRLEASLERELDQKPSDKARLEALTKQIADLERRLVLLPEEAFDSLQPMLDVEQRARLVLLRSRLKQQVLGERERRAAGGRGLPPDDAPTPEGAPPRGTPPGGRPWPRRPHQP